MGRLFLEKKVKICINLCYFQAKMCKIGFVSARDLKCSIIINSAGQAESLQCSSGLCCSFAVVLLQPVSVKVKTESTNQKQSRDQFQFFICGDKANFRDLSIFPILSFKRHQYSYMSYGSY